MNTVTGINAYQKAQRAVDALEARAAKAVAAHPEFPAEFPADARMVELIRCARASAQTVLYGAIALNRMVNDKESRIALNQAKEMVETVERQAVLAGSLIDYLSLARDLSEESARQMTILPPALLDGYMQILGGRAVKLLKRVFA